MSRKVKKRKEVNCEENKKLITFKFSLDPEEESDLIYYLLSIKNKNKRGEWLTEAAKLYKTAETTLKSTLKDELLESFRECFEKLKNKK